MSTSETADAFRRHWRALSDFERLMDKLTPAASARIRKAYADARAEGHPVLASLEIATKQVTREDRR